MQSMENARDISIVNIEWKYCAEMLESSTSERRMHLTASFFRRSREHVCEKLIENSFPDNRRTIECETAWRNES